jgi:hypothetical protein
MRSPYLVQYMKTASQPSSVGERLPLPKFPAERIARFQNSFQLSFFWEEESGDEALDDKLKQVRPCTRLGTFLCELVQARENHLPVCRFAKDSDRWKATASSHDVGEVLLRDGHHDHRGNGHVLIRGSRKTGYHPILHLLVGQLLLHQGHEFPNHNTIVPRGEWVPVLDYEVLLVFLIEKSAAKPFGMFRDIEAEMVMMASQTSSGGNTRWRSC